MANGLINKELIMKAWTHLRKTEMTIPDETLDFMRDVALEKCAEMEACNWGITDTNERQLAIPDVVLRSEQLINFLIKVREQAISSKTFEEAGEILKTIEKIN